MKEYIKRSSNFCHRGFYISPIPTLKFIMKSYGYLFGFIKLIKDTHHDEVFIEKNNTVIMRNNIWLYDYKGLVAIASELGYGKVTIIDYEELEKK